MSLVPPFELGLWNAWIFLVPALLATLYCFHLMMKKGAPGGPRRIPCESRATLYVASLSKLIFLPAVAYSFFLPLRLGTAWFAAGLPVALAGLAGIAAVSLDWARTPAGEPVTGGIYRYSRHPMYVAMVLLLLGVSVVSASWVFLLFAVVAGVGFSRPFFIRIEEAQCLGHYGAAYREYMDRTPRWLGMPRSEEGG